VGLVQLEPLELLTQVVVVAEEIKVAELVLVVAVLEVCLLEH
jgi:hypothetical protein